MYGKGERKIVGRGKKSKEKRGEQAEQATQHAILRLWKRAWGGRGTW